MKYATYTLWMVLSLLLLSTTCFAGTLPGKAAMVVRFDHAVPVNYERSLQKVVQASLNIKPDTFFEITSIIPQTANAANNQSLKAWSTENTSKIVEKMTSYGVSPDHIQVTYQPDQSTSLNEVHIFVH